MKSIKAVIYDIEDEDFYLLCNENKGIIGFFLIKFNQKDPKNYVFLTM